MRVLVLDGNENQSVAAVRSLAAAGHTVEVGAETNWSKAGWSRSCAGSFTYPAADRDADAFVAAIAARVGTGTLVLPMTERTTLPISASRDALLASGTRLVLPVHASVLRAFDKEETTRLASRLGVHVPATVLVASDDAAERAAWSVQYPVVLKPRSSHEHAAGAVRATGAPIYASDAAGLLRAWKTLSERCRAALVQEYVGGAGVGYFALMREGKVRAEFAHRRIRDVRPTGSGSALRVSIPMPPRVREAGLALLEALEWHGVAMVEFRVQADGTPTFMEVNGRFWNSLALAVHSGVDFPALVAQLAEHGDAERVAAYRPGVRCRWLLGDARHLVEVLRGAPREFPGRFPSRLATLASVAIPSRGTHHDNFSWQDPLPELGDWVHFAARKLPRSTHAPDNVSDTQPRGLRGVLHVHSTYSDGDFTLAELRETFLAAGCRFACVTDHADAFDGPRLEAYRRECEQRSDERFRFIAGLEYGCRDRMHVLGYGVTEPIDSTDPETVIAGIRALGGIAVVAHPKDSAFDGIEQFDPLPDGIEVWNTKYDGRYAPRPWTFDLLQRLKARASGIRAFYGQDLHWRRQCRELLTLVDIGELNRDAILSALKSGRFSGLRHGRLLSSDGTLEPSARAAYARWHRRSRALRDAARTVKHWIEGAGIRIPLPIKAQLRRIF